MKSVTWTEICCEKQDSYNEIWKYQKERFLSPSRKVTDRILNLDGSKIQILSHFLDPRETLMPANVWF